ncbi:MAG: hypothetical protein J0L86_04945 [Flavobacteriales bacterium]|nr:hypothetical protein [Flavobacteriales bacterium]
MDYYPFGSLVPNRHATDGSYRYGFNGMEKDDELKGNGNSINYEARMQDTRVGRFLSLDPLTKSFPHYSPYQFAGNSPIYHIDLDGRERYSYMRVFDKNGKESLLLVKKEDIVETVISGYRNSTSAGNDGPIPIYKTIKNRKQEYIVINEHEEVGWIDGVDGGLNGQKKVIYHISTKYKSLEDAKNRKNGVDGNERLMFYAKVGAMNCHNENKANGGGGMFVSNFRRNTIVKEANNIINSSGMTKLEEAYQNGIAAEVKIGGRTIIYEPDLPASGFTLMEENGFVLGPQAFKTEAELSKTLLQELFRLKNSKVPEKGLSGGQATSETNAAFEFAEQNAKNVIRK